MKFSELHKLFAAVLLVHIAAIVGVALWWDSAWLVLSFFAYLAFLWLGHDLYHHRYLSHRSFKMPVWMQKVCALLGVYCLFGTPIGIAATHVRHHRHSDTDDDPHPAHHPMQAWFWTHPSMSKRDRNTVSRLANDSWLRFIGRYYFIIYFGTVCVAGLIDPRLPVYGFFVPAVYAFFSNGLVNVVCHRYGYRRVETNDNSRNNQLINALLFFSGIAMHNNHHARPASASCSCAWYEIDLVGWIAHRIDKV